jgi:hypothetical protein
MRRLGERLAEAYPAAGVGGRPGTLALFWPGIVPRNLLFVVFALVDGFRRLAPPY